MGGDGTVNEVARGMLHSEVPMAILPKGSGNGLARHLRIPMNLNGALRSLFNSDAVDIDTFTMNDKVSLNVSGIGFDGHVANLFGQEKKRGLQGYVKHTFREFFRFKEFEATIIVDGKKMNRKAFVIAIANSSQYGNNARIAPLASVRDELLHINILRKVPPYRFDFMVDFFRGEVHQSKYSEVIEAKNISIEIASPVSFHIDGEPGGASSHFDIRIRPASLRMLVPKGTASQC